MTFDPAIIFYPNDLIKKIKITKIKWAKINQKFSKAGRIKNETLQYNDK